MILDRAKDYYENNKKILRKQWKNKYRESYEKETNIKREFGRNRYLNISKEKRKN